MATIKRDWLTLPEVRELTGLTRWKLTALQVRGKFPHAEQAGTIWLFYRGDVEKVLADINAGKETVE